MQRCEKMINGKRIYWRNAKKKILKARQDSRKDLLKRKKPKTSEEKLTFIITFYPGFKNVRNILQELHLLLAPNKEHKKIFPDVSVLVFRNGKNLKDYLVRTEIPITNERRYELCKKKTCLFCNSKRTTTTFATKACEETFKIQIKLNL